MLDILPLLGKDRRTDFAFSYWTSVPAWLLPLCQTKMAPGPKASAISLPILPK